MDTKTLSDFITWSKTTDLEEIIYIKGQTKLQIKTAQAQADGTDFSCKLIPVKAPAVGIFHEGSKGKAIALKEDMPVKKGDILGFVDMNNTSKEIKASEEGTLKIISVKDGAAVEYDQPLFFIEPKK
jgi:Biotin carboxyl carrier protein